MQYDCENGVFAKTSNLKLNAEKVGQKKKKRRRRRPSLGYLSNVVVAILSQNLSKKKILKHNCNVVIALCQ